MRLHHGNHITRAGLPGGLQHGGDFHRVMAVIINHRNAACLTSAREAPLHTLEAGKRGADGNLIDTHLSRDGNGGQRILHIMLAEHGQAEGLHVAHAPAQPIRHRYFKSRTHTVSDHTLSPHICLR